MRNSILLSMSVFIAISSKTYAQETESRIDAQQLSERDYKTVATYLAKAQMYRIAELEARIKETESFFKDRPTLSNATVDALIIGTTASLSWFMYSASERSYVIKRPITLKGSGGALGLGILQGVIISVFRMDSFARDQRKQLISMSESEAVSHFLALKAEHSALSESVRQKVAGYNLTR
jgi:hypothetical protein